MAVSTSSDTRLGCGRYIDDVWESIARPPSAHERGCPHCQAARADLKPLAEASAAQRDADATDPDLEPGPQVLLRVMEIARAEVRRGRRLPLDEPTDRTAPAELTVSQQTVAAVARRAADRVLGVQVRRSRVELAPPEPPPAAPEVDPAVQVPLAAGDLVPATYAESAPARVAVFLQISVTADTSIPSATQEIRDAVRTAMSNEVGMHAVTVRIDVRDLHDVSDV